MVQTLFGGLLSTLDQQGVNSRTLLRGIEPAVWQLIHSQPDSWLPNDIESFDEAAVDAYKARQTQAVRQVFTSRG